MNYCYWCNPKGTSIIHALIKDPLTPGWDTCSCTTPQCQCPHKQNLNYTTHDNKDQLPQLQYDSPWA